MTVRCAVIVSLDVVESQPEFEQTMSEVVKTMREHLAAMLAEHRPMVMMTFDEQDIDEIAKIELRALQGLSDA